MFNSARDSDVDKSVIETLDEVEAVLAHYVLLENDMKPIEHVSLMAMAVERAKDHPLYSHANDDDVVTMYERLQGAMKELSVNEMTRLDRVHLDLTGDGDVPAWQSTSIPSIAFARLRSTDSLYQEGRQVAIAVYFDPALVGTRHVEGKTGWYSKPDVYDPLGYTAVVRSFATVDHARRAKADLERALQTLRTLKVTDTALEDDPIRSCDVDQSEDLRRPYDLNGL